jgi:hypothetical protein
MRVSPNADAQASNSWTPRSKSASGDWKRSSVYYAAVQIMPIYMWNAASAAVIAAMRSA